MPLELPPAFNLPQPGLMEQLVGGLNQAMQAHAASPMTLLAKLKNAKGGSLIQGGQPTGQGQSVYTGQEVSSQFSPTYDQDLSTALQASADPAHQRLGKAMGEQIKGERDIWKVERKGSLAKEAAMEKPLMQMSDNLQNMEMTDMRFGRLSNLFSPQNEKNFPSSLMVGLFSKDGDIRPTYFSQLSPDAQESIKLVQDELTGAKDTFGSRVTNFDVQNYMKRLPSLLNSPDGRRRVLRDLSLINKLNRLHDEEVLKIVDEHGGSGRISLSKAEALFRKQNKDKIANIRQQFVNPENKVYKSMQDIDPTLYVNRRIEDENGKRFISDGKNWIPQ